MMGLNELGNRVILKHCLLLVIGGEGGIRTHGRKPDTRFPGVPVKPLQHLSAERVGFEPTRHFCPPLFESGTINHSVTSPWLHSQL